MTYYVDEIEFVTIECCACGMPFAMTEDFKRRRTQDHDWFYCPSGHKQHFSGKTQEQKLREQLDKTQSQLDAERGRSAAAMNQRDEISRTYKRMRDRVKNGVCPCCTRTFQNLLQHMKTEHPEFGNHDQLKTMRQLFGLTQAALAAEIGVHDHHVSRYENQHQVPTWVPEGARSIGGWIGWGPMPDKYHPSTGSEGMAFQAQFCDRCQRDTFDGEEGESCMILMGVYSFKVTDPEYPAEWTYDAAGRPTCTAFLLGRAAAVSLPDTVDMFG